MWRRLQPAGSALLPSLSFDARDRAEMSLGGVPSGPGMSVCATSRRETCLWRRATLL